MPGASSIFNVWRIFKDPTPTQYQWSFNEGGSIVFVALAALCWGLPGGIAGILISSGWDSIALSFYRGVIGLLIFFSWLILRPHGSGLRNRGLWFWSVIAGFGVAGNFSFYFASVAQCNVAIAVTLMYSAPVFVSFVSFALKLERPTALSGLQS